MTWIIFVFAAAGGSLGQVSMTTHEFNSRDSCITAVNELKQRGYVRDAYCVKK